RLFYLVRCSVHHAAFTLLYPLSLHDALPIWAAGYLAAANSAAWVLVSPVVGYLTSTVSWRLAMAAPAVVALAALVASPAIVAPRSEEHTSELQSRENLVCRLLLEKKTNKNTE